MARMHDGGLSGLDDGGVLKVVCSRLMSLSEPHHASILTA